MVKEITGSDTYQFTQHNRADVALKRMNHVNNRLVRPDNDEPIPKLNNVPYVVSSDKQSSIYGGQTYYPSALERLTIAQGEKPKSQLERLKNAM